MDSYFGFNAGGFKSAFKQKLSAAAKFLPKDIMNRGSHLNGHVKRNSELFTPQQLEEDELNAEEHDQHVDAQKPNGKSKKPKRKLTQQLKPSKSPVKESNEEIFEGVKEKLPDADKAVNGIIKGLL